MSSLTDWAAAAVVEAPRTAGRGIGARAARAGSRPRSADAGTAEGGRRARPAARVAQRSIWESSSNELPTMRPRARPTTPRRQPRPRARAPGGGEGESSGNGSGSGRRGGQGSQKEGGGEKRGNAPVLGKGESAACSADGPNGRRFSTRKAQGRGQRGKGGARGGCSERERVAWYGPGEPGVQRRQGRATARAIEPPRCGAEATNRHRGPRSATQRGSVPDARVAAGGGHGAFPRDLPPAFRSLGGWRRRARLCRAQPTGERSTRRLETDRAAGLQNVGRRRLAVPPTGRRPFSPSPPT